MQSIRHEIAIMAQLDHPSICKLLGMDSSHEEVPSMVFEYFSDTSLYRVCLVESLSLRGVNREQHLNRSKGNFQENAAIVSGPNNELVLATGHGLMRRLD